MNEKTLTHLCCFSGIGGESLAAHMAGFETLCHIEIDSYAQKVLKKRFPNVPIHSDINTYDAGELRGRVDLLTGGFPCQDISGANRTAEGLSGSRSSLFFQMVRIAEQCRPAYLCFENVGRLRLLGLDLCLNALGTIGYSARAVVIPAAAVGAWHKRERLFIVGRRNGSVSGSRSDTGGEPSSPQHDEASVLSAILGGANRPSADDNKLGSLPCVGPSNSRQGVCSNRIGEYLVEEQEWDHIIHWPSPNPESMPSKGDGEGQNAYERQASRAIGEIQDFGERSRLFEPKLCGDFHGLSRGMDGPNAVTPEQSKRDGIERLRCLGNANPPALYYPIYKTIADQLRSSNA